MRDYKLDSSVRSEFDPTINHPYYFMRNGLLKEIAENARLLHGDLLDFGCGAKPYKQLFSHCSTYIGIDYESPGHDHKNEQIDFFYDGKKLPFSNDSFDSVFCSEVFEHVFNLKDILPELNRVLKPGGYMLLTCPFVWPEHEKPFDFARYTVFALTDILESAGFEVIKVEKSGDFVKTISQLQVAWIHDVLAPKFTFRFLIRFFRWSTIPIANIVAIAMSKVLPTNKDLYLSNVLLVKKNR